MATENGSIEVAAEEISIPANSFTAFRFLYGDAADFSQMSSVVLLGSIPKIWFKEHKSGLLRSWTKATYNGIRHGVTEMVESTSRFGLPDQNRDPYTRKLSKLLGHFSDDEEEDEDSEEDDDEERHVTHDHDWMQDNNKSHDLGYDKWFGTVAAQETPLPVAKSQNPALDMMLPAQNIQQNHDDAQIQALKHSHSTATGTSQSFTTANSELKSTPPSPNRQVDRADKTSHNENRSTVSLASISTITDDQSTPDGRSVMFAEPATITRLKSKQILNLKPTPADNPKLMPLDDRHDVVLHKVKTVASHTKKRLRRDVHKIHQRKIFSRLSKAYEVGEVIKMEKMLTLVKEKSKSQANFTEFTEAEPCDTRVVERWKEYIVVARSTGNPDGPILLQFYTKREIPDDINSKHFNNDLDFTLDRTCVVNFYSSLDKTIAISKNDKVYIVKCQSQTSSVRWLTFLNETLGISAPTTLKTEIPTLGISMNIAITSEMYNLVNSKKDDEKLQLFFTKNGYHRKNPEIIELLSKKLRSRLTDAGFKEISEKFKDEVHLLGFCWRHYDRLEWLFGETLNNLFWQQSMNNTHVLELRHIEHFPLTVETSEGGLLKEPVPIEGFLARLTTQSGSFRAGLLQKPVFKFGYFFTSDNLLFFSHSYKALPPLPYTDELMKEEFLKSEDFTKLRLDISPLYHHNPYPLDRNNRIAWLKPGMSDDEFLKRDKYSVYELERRVGSIIRADNLLDLRDVEDIEVFPGENVPLSVELANAFIWNGTVSSSEGLKSNRDCYFKLTISNGTSIVLRAPSTETRDQWIGRLKELRTYWALRAERDILRMRSLKEKNLHNLNIDDYTEGNISESSRKWENSRGIADVSVFNITPYSIFRPIIISGFLYQKPKKHSSFRKFYVVLVPGFVILYSAFTRRLTGKPQDRSSHAHYMTIPISECYVYSGAVCALDLVENEQEFDTLNPGSNYIPRVYDDGWLSADDESLRCFTLWFGTKRAIAGKGSVNSGLTDFQRLSRQEAPRNPGLIRMVSRLGVTGRSMVFMCRSRQERDLWVRGLYTQLERFGINSLEN